MANNRSLGTGRLETPSRSIPAMYIHAGWTDFAAGKGYRPDYDEFSEINQKRYELGRHYAALSLAATGEVPKWYKNRLLKLHGSVHQGAHAEIQFFAKTAR